MMHAARAVPMLGLPVGWARLGISRGEDASVALSMLGLPGRMGRLGNDPRLGSTFDPFRRQRGTPAPVRSSSPSMRVAHICIASLSSLLSSWAHTCIASLSSLLSSWLVCLVSVRVVC